MTEAFLVALIAAIIAMFRRRLDDATAAARAGGELSAQQRRALISTVTGLVVDARRQVWAAQVLFMRSEALKAGGEAWFPDEPDYVEAAVDWAARQVPGDAFDDTGFQQFAVTMERHVRAAGWATMSDAVEDAPSSVGLADSLSDLEDNLSGFPETVREAIVEEVNAHESRRKPVSQQLEDTFAQVADRIDKALAELEDAGFIDEKTAEEAALRRVPDADRRDVNGKLILRPFAWARVVHYDGQQGPCGFCIMLASRGPVYSSSVAAGMRADAYHDNCHCTAVPVYTSRSWEGKSAQEKYAALYDKTVVKNDLHTAEARTAMDNATRGKRSDEKSAARNARKGA